MSVSGESEQTEMLAFSVSTSSQSGFVTPEHVDGEHESPYMSPAAVIRATQAPRPPPRFPSPPFPIPRAPNTSARTPPPVSATPPPRVPTPRAPNAGARAPRSEPAPKRTPSGQVSLILVA